MKKNIFYFIIPLFCMLMIKFINTSTQSEEITISNSSDVLLISNIPENIDFNFHVKPIISDKCFACHGPDEKKREANLRLDTEEGLYQLTEDLNSYVINKKNPEKSELLRRIFHENKSISMPPPESNLILTDHEKSILKKWIIQGAEWKKHWSYIKPILPSVPEVKNKDWVNNPIDNFILKNIENNQLNISNKEEKEILIRRVYFDLIGLPPSVEEIDNFLNDNSEKAYSNLVDKLLNSENFGERMASIWMDIARYGDSHGYQDDLERVMWPWRDWVIHAYNTNLSYDKFITWQIAGDLIPNASKEQIIATGFNRNHKITQEGGVIPEEYRSEYVADRTNTTSKVMMGLTMECARCHSHKYDDISHEEYYGMYSYFNNIDEDGLISYSDKAPKPNITVTRNDIEKDLGFINLPDSISEVTFMVMRETENLRKTYILDRGSYDAPTKEVESMTPTAVLPINIINSNRLDLANWFFDDENPLTSRVVVNRLWQQFFGVGIVATPDDFGSQGNRPTNPELLDWLAVTFVKDNWDTKKFIKRIVTSSTYMQSSKVNISNKKLDPENMFLSYFPRQKLTAEMIRDNILASSGLLVNKIGGPSVKPYQPKGLWDEVIGGGGGSLARYIPSTGENLYRRSVYTFWKKTVPPPSMMIFDASSRDNCEVKRQDTSTPLQSLTLMNNPEFIKAANYLSGRIFNEKISLENKIKLLYRTVTGRSPSDIEIEKLAKYYDDENLGDDFLAFNKLTMLVYNLDETSQKS
ncbi:MAG: PSD1 and planctomycete cytochrome C domain-containing protein [Bacteroidota bacterium]|nr:PSD1 and planctomycete cytochrome C domain-containing protein [Bacteroidota bacterium]MEC8367406.1 PSD1 and planctomycete cytochrome C domain-containing protein [Bacteroidota bacterium]